MKKPKWRSLIVPTVILVLMAGVLPGGGEPPPANAGLPAGPLPGGGGSGILSIAGISFVSADSRNAYTYTGWGGLGGVTPSGGSPWPLFTASVELPDGATINSLTLFYSDSDASADVILWLSRCDGAGNVEELAGVGSGTDGMSSRSTTSIFQPIVDNEHYSYILYAELDSANVILYGARVAFTPNFSAAGRAPEALPSERPAQEAGVPSATDPVVAAMRGEQVVAQSGGEIIPLAVHPARSESARDVNVPADTSPEQAGPQPQGGGGADWRRYTVAAADFHALSSSTQHGWSPGGARFVTGGIPILVIPLNLIHGRTIQRYRFTYYNNSSTDPLVSLYRVDRQGNGRSWSYSPHASGGYFTFVSPALAEPVNNQDYAYYFSVILNSSAGSDLQAVQVQIDYLSDLYLPAILRGH